MRGTRCSLRELLDYHALLGTFWIYGSSAIRTNTLRTGELLMVLPRLPGEELSKLRAKSIPVKLP